VSPGLAKRAQSFCATAPPPPADRPATFPGGPAAEQQGYDGPAGQPAQQQIRPILIPSSSASSVAVATCPPLLLPRLRRNGGESGARVHVCQPDSGLRLARGSDGGSWIGAAPRRLIRSDPCRGWLGSPPAGRLQADSDCDTALPPGVQTPSSSRQSCPASQLHFKWRCSRSRLRPSHD